MSRFPVLALTAVALAASVNGDANRLVADLRDDEERFNATRAAQELAYMGEKSVPALTSALTSQDWQQRQIVGATLIVDSELRPTQELLEVLVEALKDDALPRGEGSCTPVYNGADAFRYLAVHTGDAIEKLRLALASGDGQQRFLAAALLASADDAPSRKRCIQILLPHLRDNDIAVDALLACSSMSCLDQSCAGQLHAAKESADPQQAALLDLIIARITDQPQQVIESAISKLPDLGSPVRDPSKWPIDLFEIGWGSPRWPEPQGE